MKQVAIVTDSVACILREMVEKYGIEVIPVGLHFRDRVYRDGIDISTTEFTPVMRAHTGQGLVGVAFYCEG